MDIEKQLGFLKQQTQNIDSEMLILLKRRFQTQKRIFDAQYKNGLEVSTQDVDDESMEYVSKKAREMEISDVFIHSLYSQILDHNSKLKEEFLKSKEK